MNIFYKLFRFYIKTEFLYSDEAFWDFLEFIGIEKEYEKKNIYELF